MEISAEGFSSCLTPLTCSSFDFIHRDELARVALSAGLKCNERLWSESQMGHLRALQPWEQDSTALCLNLHTRNLGLILAPPLWGGSED